MNTNERKIAVFSGRFQGLSKCHHKAIMNLQKKYSKVHVLVVTGKNTSKESKNFLDVDTRIEMLSISNPGIIIHKAINSFLPGAIKYFKIWDGKSKIVISAGSDRIDSYKKSFKNVPYQFEFDEDDIERTPGISGTYLRKSLEDNSFEDYKRISANGLNSKFWFDKLKQLWFKQKSK